VIFFNFGSFFLKDLGSGTFIRLQEALTVEGSLLVSVGESFVLFSLLLREKHEKFPSLSVKVYSGLKIGEVKYFDAEDWDIKEVYLGRGRDCQVVLEDCLVSTHQATLFFSRISGWMVVDGDLAQQKPSTNGTW
jgi:hypothetical protein